MRQFFKDLVEGKFAITYTLTTIANMVPREIRLLSRIPVLSHLTRVGQFFWFITKIIFFVMIISWFKPQYNHTGARIVLILITFGVIFFAWWMMKKELDRKKALR
jgi:hypothetical protein